MRSSDSHLRAVLQEFPQPPVANYLPKISFRFPRGRWIKYAQYIMNGVTYRCHACRSDTSRDVTSLLWRHNGHDSVSNHQPHTCLLNRLFRRRSKKTSTLRVTGLCAGTSPGTGEFPAQMASNAENVSIWWRHHAKITFSITVIAYEGTSCATYNITPLQLTQYVLSLTEFTYANTLLFAT